MKIIKAYMGFLLTFLVVDAIWITAFAGNFYKQQLSGVLSATPNFSLVGIFYFGYAAGAVYLLVIKASDCKSSLIAGAVFGALTYGTYTVTNYTILDGWSMAIVITDVLWGAFVTAVSTCTAFYFYNGKAVED